MSKKWKISKDSLFRGDAKNGVRPAAHGSDKSLVRHILFLDGPGRLTPYLSFSESEDIAGGFAGKTGKTYVTVPNKWRDHGVKHRSRTELQDLLKGSGKGDAAWPDAFEVAQARRYVEEHLEHLGDFSDLPDQSSVDSSTGGIIS
jgi:hypothetical protein